MAALCRAAERGKYVTAIVELKARFDEARNIEWARELEEAGVQVIYGVKKLKTHAKVCIVVRREPRGIVRYVHFGTGNYNETTARLYSDVSYLTCNDELGSDASAFLNAVTGYSQPQAYRLIDRSQDRARSDRAEDLSRPGGWIKRSLSLSKLLVASSRIRMRGSARMARAMAKR